MRNEKLKMKNEEVKDRKYKLIAEPIQKMRNVECSIFNVEVKYRP